MQAALFIAGIALVVIGVIAGAAWMDRKRRDALGKAAEEMGLEFFPNGSQELQTDLSVLKLFNTGRGRKLTKLIQGESDEVSISLFDFRYTTGSGKHSQNHNQTVAALQSSQLDIPEFSLRPETMFDKIGGMIGLQDIDFDSHPKFSAMFVLKGADESLVRNFFNSNILTYFEGLEGISVEAVRGKLVIYRPRKIVAVNEIKNLLAQAYEIYGVLVDN